MPRVIAFPVGVDIVHMPRGVRGARYLVLAREYVSSYVEGRALVKARALSMCQFILEDIVSRYGSFCQVRADRKELKLQEAKDFFRKLGIDLKLTMAYNPTTNGKVECGNPSIVSELVKACGGRKGQWPTLLPLTL